MGVSEGGRAVGKRLTLFLGSNTISFPLTSHSRGGRDKPELWNDPSPFLLSCPPSLASQPHSSQRKQEKTVSACQPLAGTSSSTLVRNGLPLASPRLPLQDDRTHFTAVYLDGAAQERPRQSVALRFHRFRTTLIHVRAPAADLTPLLAQDQWEGLCFLLSSAAP